MAKQYGPEAAVILHCAHWWLPLRRAAQETVVCTKVRERSLWEPNGCGLVNFVDFFVLSVQISGSG